MSLLMAAKLACDELKMARWGRKHPENAVVYADQSGQYCSVDYQALLKRYNLQGSMSAKVAVTIMPERKASFTR